MQAQFLKANELTLSKYRDFVGKANFLKRLSPSISNLKGIFILDELASVGSDLFADEIEIAKHVSGNPDIGVFFIDIPECELLSEEQNCFYGVAAALAMTVNIFKVSSDIVNKTPFTVYAARPDKSDKLKQLGLDTLAPETKLGFHTDGIIKNESVYMPKMIMLYNVSISYKDAGNFRWKPFSLWSKKDYFMNKIGLGHKFKICLTPSVYDQGAQGLRVVTPTYVRAPIFVNDKESGFPLYLNGNVESKEGLPDFDLGIIERLRESLQDEDFGYIIPQKVRRVIFASNLTGAHAREIFKEPLSYSGFTRIFLRSVDQNVLDTTAFVQSAG